MLLAIGGAQCTSLNLIVKRHIVVVASLDPVMNTVNLGNGAGCESSKLADVDDCKRAQRTHLL